MQVKSVWNNKIHENSGEKKKKLKRKTIDEFGLKKR